MEAELGFSDPIVQPPSQLQYGTRRRTLEIQECLQQILRVFDDNNDFTTLSRLLVTSKHIASVTLPFLYRDPYRSAFHEPYRSTFHETQLRVCNPSPYDILTYTLLSRLSVASLPKTLLLILTSDPTDTSSATTTTTITKGTTKSSLDYLAQIRHLYFKHWELAWECNWRLLSLDLDPRQLEYIQSDEFDQVYQSNPFAWGYIHWTTEPILQEYYRITTRLDAFWCLAEPILEQLQSITIPISRIKQYHKVVGRFKNLEFVHFATTQPFEDLPEGNEDEGNIDNGTSKRRKLELVQEMMWFVKEHIQLFKGKLRTVKCLEDAVWCMVDQEYIQRVQLSFYRLLPPLSRPTHLGNDNWLQFLAYPEAVDLSHVREFNNVFIPKTAEDVIFIDKHSIIQRCRSLRKLFIHSESPGKLKWAVKEKRAFEMPGWNIVTGNNHDERRPVAQDETSQQAHRIHGLIPLEYIDIGLPLSSTDDLEDIVFAFSQTLKHLTIRSLDFLYMELPVIIHVGKGWIDLPALTELHLNQRVCRMVLDPQLLAHCPSLISLRLDDNTREYSCRDIVPCPPALLERLDHLHLTGWPALTFNPATLSSTRELTHLTLQIASWGLEEYGEYHGREFIPPVEELKRSYGILEGSPACSTAAATDLERGIYRPRWTWDWHFPLLTHLHLTSEFAYLFEFKFLYGCPALTTLWLDITSTIPGEHTRDISIADLSVPISLSSSQRTTDHLSLPCLSQLELSGEWMIDDSVMQQLLTKTFPRVEQLRLQLWTMTTLESLLKVLRTLPQNHDDKTNKLRSLFITNPSLKDRARLGIVEDPNFHYRINNNGVDGNSNDDMNEFLEVSLDILGPGYRLLKQLPE
ncbi:hypothetical protein BGZ89_000596 [Linnemannia elongata]|nr:hypothetical protein BGZ89_000596 [Linnemannia elongata]